MQIIFELSLRLRHVKKSLPEDNAQFIYKRFYGEEQIELFKHELSHIEWNNIIKTLDNPNTAYANFFDMFFKTYDKYFPKVIIKTKAKKLIKALGLQKALENPLRRNKSFMNCFFKSVLYRMNSNKKIINILKQSKSKQRKHTTLTNYLNVLEILKHGML